MEPILVVGVLDTVNPSVYEQRAKLVKAKARYSATDLADWTCHAELRIGMAPVSPVNSVKAMRGVFVASDADFIAPYARAVFEAYWGDLSDISQDDVLADVVARVGLDRDAFFAAIAPPGCKSRLRATTDELVTRGGFGSPTMFVDGDDM